jgi:anti-sigma factor RsiW
MDCLKNSTSGAETLLDYCSGALNPAHAVELERHIETCPDCRTLVEAQRELWSQLDRWKAPAVSENFNARMYARIAQENQLPRWKQWIRRLTEPAAPYSLWKPAALAAACAVMAVGFLVEVPGPLHTVAQKAPAAQADTQPVDIEQVASALEELDLLMPSTGSSPASTSNANPM